MLDGASGGQRPPLVEEAKPCRETFPENVFQPKAPKPTPTSGPEVSFIRNLRGLGCQPFGQSGATRRV